MHPWSDVTREERFFTAMLFQAVSADPGPMARMISGPLRLDPSIEIKDVGYEVCFLRDAWHAQLMASRASKKLEKQTFDLVFWMSDGLMVIVEAKAHQGFNMGQLDDLVLAREAILQAKLADAVRLLGLHSSKYTPAMARSAAMDCVTWKDMMAVYPGMASHFAHADRIYGD